MKHFRLYFLFPVNNGNFYPTCYLNDIVAHSHESTRRGSNAASLFSRLPSTLYNLSHMGSWPQGGRTQPLSQIHKCSPLLARSGLPPSFPALSPGIKSLLSLTAFCSPGHTDKNKHAEDHQKQPRMDPLISRPLELEGSDPE